MFEHVTVLLSFVFAIALTHLLTSVTELIWARGRVLFSRLHALWMLIALLILLVDWLGYWGLNVVKDWNAAEVTLQFCAAVIQYFTCSLLSLRVPEEGSVDMQDFYERQRPAIFTAFAGLLLISMFQNYHFSAEGIASSVWIVANGVLLVMLVAVVIAGWAKSRRLQEGAALVMLGLVLTFLANYALSS